jgi:hypothetical protein
MFKCVLMNLINFKMKLIRLIMFGCISPRSGESDGECESKWDIEHFTSQRVSA